MAKELFILGAGFSYAVTNGTMPLLNGLTKELVDNLKLEEDEDLLQLWQEYVVNPNIGNVQNPNKSNFEDIMTFLSSKFAYETYKDEHFKAALYQYITERIVAILQMINLEKEISNAPHLLQFANYLRKTKADIFSFNYDLVLENLLLKIPGSSRIFDPLYTIKGALAFLSGTFCDSASLFWRDSLKIYKLHGSINWMYDPDTPTGVQIVTSKTLPEYCRGLHYLLIPPTILKNFVFHNNLLDIQWQEFREKLCLAEKIHIIGYSIPKTDIATYYALKTCIQPKCIVNMVVKNPTKAQIKGWKELFDKQEKQSNLNLFEEGFNENSLQELGLV